MSVKVPVTIVKDLLWLGGVCYLSSILDKLNQLNLSIQEKGGDIFLFNGKVNAMKIKLSSWTEIVRYNIFNKFTFLQKLWMGNENFELIMTLRRCN